MCHKPCFHSHSGEVYVISWLLRSNRGDGFRERRAVGSASGNNKAKRYNRAGTGEYSHRFYLHFVKNKNKNKNSRILSSKDMRLVKFPFSTAVLLINSFKKELQNTDKKKYAKRILRNVPNA